ncbi:MAG TPA: Nif3-like dinuclear metal center hexameric protein [Candidatus Acidoferrales bacterium]|nr:Nif3-like dinuclear metal center hexameric protein [Candidatus Acidoferrales bacterium]
MKLHELVKRIGDDLPIELVSDQDNVGLIVGNYDDECERMTLAYELNCGVLDEALKSHSNLVVTYHTPLFRPKSSFTSSVSKPDPLFEAARKSINVFAIHSALDVIKEGLNFDLAARLGLNKIKFLSPMKSMLFKIVVFVPASHSDKVREAMAKAGAGRIGNYYDCSFVAEGKGSFVPTADALPYVGQTGRFERVDEHRLEMIVEKSLVGPAVNEMLKVHPYEEPAYDIYPLMNNSAEYGFGAIGELDEPVPLRGFLSHVKKIIGTDFIKVSHSPDVNVKKVAVSVGSGVSFYKEAVHCGADIFVTGDVKHHDFREAQSHGPVLADATHQGTERFLPDVMFKVLKKTFSDSVAIEISEFKTINAITI